ncbi:MAG: DUF4040 domain-containing protein [Cyanobacteria bacterium SID2]|nr:DUF4040 domain-containing protein [Cyanobacteria bacterium SID2]MBP0003289.1 DUF4040 domain-containing protein [Cyanobacteria bacterium SBC]
MTEDWYVVAIVVLLPLTAGMLVTQVNPYHALVIRGILGAVAALVYALFGAADVALTEALVGTMLSITLYAIAVRSSLSMRVGIVGEESHLSSADGERPNPATPVLSALRHALDKYYMRLELVVYPNAPALKTALTAKDVHTIWVNLDETLESDRSTRPLSTADFDSPPIYQIQTRVQRLYEILQGELPHTAQLVYIDPAESRESEAAVREVGIPDSAEVQ